jgi:catalase
MNFQRDGHMQMAVPQGRANYEPNSLSQVNESSGPRECPATGFTSFPAIERPEEEGKLRLRPELFADHYSQARLFYRSQTPIEQAHIATALVFELSKVNLEHVRTRVLSRLLNIDEDLATRVADGLAMPLPEAAPAARAPVDMAPSPALSILQHGQPPLTGRKIGLLFAEGSDKAAVEKLQAELEQAGATVMLVSPKVGEQTLKGGTLKAHGQLAGSPSVLFDAVASIVMPDAAERLARDSAAKQWFMDAWSHAKTIGACPATQTLLASLGIEADEGIVEIAQFASVAPARHWDREPKVRMLA